MDTLLSPMQPPIPYYGNKSKLSSWIISQFPQHHTYVEVFGGSAAVLFNKEPSPVEVYNDLDSNIVNLFRVLRDKRKSKELMRLLDLTPYSREEHQLGRSFFRNKTKVGEIELARRYYMAIAGSFCSKFDNVFRTSRERNSASQFRSYRNKLPAVIERLADVTIENRPWSDLIPQYDTEQTLFYLDPPYVASTRGRDNYYAHEMSDQQHVDLLEMAKKCQGNVVISGYACELYDDMLKGWRRVAKATSTSRLGQGPKENVEVLRMNY